MVPTRDEFEEVIERARLAGRQTAKKRYEELKAKANPQKQMIDACGGSIITLNVDGRSRMGKFLRSLIDDPLPNVRVSQGTYGGYVLDIVDIAPFQEQSVCEAADRAALEVIKNSLGIEGYVTGYLT